MKWCRRQIINSCVRDTENPRKKAWDSAQISDENEHRSGEEDVKRLEDEESHLTVAILRRSVKVFFIRADHPRDTITATARTAPRTVQFCLACGLFTNTGNEV